MIIYFVLAVLFCAFAIVRFAPSDPVWWHIDPGSIAVTACTQLTKMPSGARVSCLRPEDPETVLRKLDSIALASSRTTRLAGSPETGKITWISRSLIWSFPDYTTAQVTLTPQGTQLDILGLQRFGNYDWGVNAARLSNWLGRL